MDNSLKQTRIELLLLFLLYLVILPTAYMEYDMGFWREWAVYLHRNGLTAAYNPGSPINYFPVYVYALYIFDLLQGTEASIIHNINSIKVLFVCFDFLPVVVLCAFRQRILDLKIPHLFLMLNIAYVFNSMVWGQIDAIYTNLAFLAIVTVLVYPTAGVLLYVLALNTKQQAIIFLPVMALAGWHSIRQAGTLVKAIAAAVALQAVILIPFMHDGGPERLVSFARNAVGLYHNLSISAFNIWYLLPVGNPYFINDTDIFFIVSYRLWGLAMFAISALLVITPLAKHIGKLRREQRSFAAADHSVLFLATGMLCLVFFFFNTQMHERYAHPIIIFFFFYGVASRNYRLFLLASVPYFLSLDKAFSFPHGYLPIVHYKVIYASRAIALWYTGTLVYGSYLMIKESRRISVPA